MRMNQQVDNQHIPLKFKLMALQKLQTILYLGQIQKEVLKKYCSALTKISKGHQSLYDNKDKLKEKGIKKMIAAYADDLNDIVEQFKK